MIPKSQIAPDSSNCAIETRGLSKTFGRCEKTVQAVIDLDLSVPAGQVFGFLGPNGTGKSTTIRMLMDLIRPSSGKAAFFGRPVRELYARRRVGALVEGADFYAFMTAQLQPGKPTVLDDERGSAANPYRWHGAAEHKPRGLVFGRRHRRLVLGLDRRIAAAFPAPGADRIKIMEKMDG